MSTGTKSHIVHRGEVTHSAQRDRQFAYVGIVVESYGRNLDVAEDTILEGGLKQQQLDRSADGKTPTRGKTLVRIYFVNSETYLKWRLI